MFFTLKVRARKTGKNISQIVCAMYFIPILLEEKSASFRLTNKVLLSSSEIGIKYIKNMNIYLKKYDMF